MIASAAVNVATESLPESWRPYRFLAFPVLGIAVLAGVIAEVLHGRHAHAEQPVHGEQPAASGHNLVAVGQGNATNNITVNHTPPKVPQLLIVAIVAIVALWVSAYVLTQPRSAAQSAPPPAGASTVPNGASGSPIRAGDLQVLAQWCLTLDVSCGYGEGIYYWPTAVADLSGKIGATAGRIPDAPGVKAAGSGEVELTLQTDSAEAITITGLDITMVSRKPNLTSGLIYHSVCVDCGATVTVRPFKADIDQQAPQISPIQTNVTTATPAAAGRAVGFPYQVSLVDTEVFAIVVSDKGCDCVFDLDLQWVARGKRGHTLLDNDGTHFEIVGTDGLPAYHPVLPGFTDGAVANSGSATIVAPGAAPTLRPIKSGG